MLVDMRPVESSENITIMDEIDELLGTRRSYGWNSGSRPSMISAKYRLKEERRKVLKISVNKMKKIDDAESSLCRSVLINNTVKRLQAETRDDRTTGRTSPASPPSPTSGGYGYHSPHQSPPCGGPVGNPQLVDITNLRESSCTNGAGGAGVGVNAVTVGKTLTNNNNNISSNNNNNNNNKPLTEAQSLLLAADHHHHHHLLHQHHHHHHHLQPQQQQQQQQQHHHHHNNHHHHHHHLQQQQHLHHHHHQSSSAAAAVAAPGGPLPYGYDDDVDEEDVVDDEEEDDVDEDTIASIMMQLPSTSPRGKRKRCVDEPLDDLLSQFINNNQREDEDVNVVDLDLHEYPAAKRLRTDEAAAAAAAAAAVAGTTPSADASPLAAADLCSPDCWSLMDACCDDTLDLYGGQVSAAVERQDVLLQPAAVTSASAAASSSSSSSSVDCCSSLSLTLPPPPPPSLDEHHHYGVAAPSSTSAAGSTSPTNLSCGQASSMFSEMQSAMFRNLIASLES